MNILHYKYMLYFSLFLIPILRFSADITNIIDSARREQELEQDFISIEEEWSEQVLCYTHIYTYMYNIKYSA